MRIGQQIKDLSQRQTVRQVLALLSVNIIGIPLGIVTNIIVTNYLGSQLFGDYKFICSVFNFASLIFSFGVFQAGNRAIVLSNNRNKTRGLYGALLILLCAIYILMALGLYTYSIYDNNLADKGITNMFMLVIPLSLIPLWSLLFETVLAADNQIGLLAKMRLYPKLINLILAGLLLFLVNKITVNKLLVILLLYHTSQLILYIYVTIKLKPTFSDCKEKISTILYYDKIFGFNVYIGSLFAIGFGYLTEILISYFGVNNQDVGFYSLAITLTQPLTFIPSTIATTHYKSFAKAPFIQKKLIVSTIIMSLGAVVLLWILIPPFVHYLYGPEFEPVIGINFFVCIGVFFHGISDFFNRYLQANGYGKKLRNTAFIVGVTTICSSVLLIPQLGAYGAAFSKIATGLIYFIVICCYYLSVVRKNQASQK